MTSKHAYKRCIALRVFLLSCLAWFSLVVAVYASASDCSPIEDRDRNIAKPIHSQGLLWRVESQQGSVSHLFGTIHVSDPRVNVLSAALQAALVGSSQFIMEVVIDRESVSTMSSAMILPHDEMLKKVSRPHVYERALELLKHHGVNESMAMRLKPWAAYTILSLPPRQVGVALDIRLMRLAQKHQLQVYGLESMEEQISLFDSMDMTDQHRLLRQVICNYELVQSDLDQLIDLYRNRDLGAMLQMAEKYRYPGSEKFLDTLLWRRNVIMANRMQASLKAGGAFVAVGALHLPGDRGILQLLTNTGFSVRAID